MMTKMLLAPGIMTLLGLLAAVRGSLHHALCFFGIALLLLWLNELTRE